MTPRTLKHYEDCGQLRPATVGENGYRTYTLSQVDRVSAILLLRDHGFSLAEIRELLSHGDLRLRGTDIIQARFCIQRDRHRRVLPR